MNEQIVALKSKIKQADEELTRSNQYLELFSQEVEDSSDFSGGDETSLKTLALVLQYRLDTQNVLIQLGKLQNYLLQLLGIESQHSYEMNVERLSHALGTDELKQILSRLNHIVDSLLRILALQNKSTLGAKPLLINTKNEKMLNVIHKALSHQQTFATKMAELQLVLENIPGAPHQGVILDHIAALQGPVSRFEKALQHGLVLSSGLYQQLENKKQLQFQVPNTVVQPSMVLQNNMSSPGLKSLFKPSPQLSDAERLEERAAAKRLGHFFNH
ncbi:hypothetical protein [Legionella waltersii]|uniref:Uncharacterized protein n=1 Tax=Legionella waltersii TaxID=66969 RepID=A0A0W1AP04_9GAMM|nr:hypothetical protein [Legionella waltersii]KTD83083.1 hypothetical protein Lwal_0071 [Legionella waltersii]SNV08081.1 Uncharacterised protein [Legionella waltersii]